MNKRIHILKNYRKKYLSNAFLLFGAALICSFYLTYKVVHYKTYIWLPSYFLSSSANDIDHLQNGHLLFMIADHHEPGYGERGIKKSTAWCETYKKNIEGIYDDYGNPFEYTWFYAYDHLNSPVLFNLNELVFAGLGEVEFHWHHGPDTNETFPPKLKKAIAWFNSHGALTPEGLNPKPQFAFVHGNWALDNGGGDSNLCGVNKELDILKQHGCYADFTFSTFSTVAQPQKINSIYYAHDIDSPKSYNSGEDVKVGSQNDGFMIFEGPISCDWRDLIWECGALESTSPFKPHRLNLWLKYAPTVKGRPNWLFVKVYTHGVQSRDVILSDQFRELLFYLKRICKEKKLSVHFVSAREAYNIVKAAEDGLKGDPEEYRDYLLKKPLNRLILIPTRITDAIVSNNLIRFKVLEPVKTTFHLKMGPVKSISGFLKSYRGESTQEGTYLLTVRGDGICEVVSKKDVQFNNKIVTHLTKSSGDHIYKILAM